MSANVFAHIPSTYYREVPFESVHQRAPRLTHILFTTSFAADAVNQVGALTTHVLLALIQLLGVITNDYSTVINLGAILTIHCLAAVDGITAWFLLFRGVLSVPFLLMEFGRDQHIPKGFWTSMTKDRGFLTQVFCDSCLF